MASPRGPHKRILLRRPGAPPRRVEHIVHHAFVPVDPGRLEVAERLHLLHSVREQPEAGFGQADTRVEPPRRSIPVHSEPFARDSPAPGERRVLGQ
eukprot:795499-Alexandrium_andersonii.AAC.1